LTSDPDKSDSIKRKYVKEIDDIDVSDEDDDNDSEDDESDDYSEKDGKMISSSKSLPIKKTLSAQAKLVCQTCGENMDNEVYFEIKDHLFCSEECMERGSIQEKPVKKVLIIFVKVTQ
jgi:predicted nucleic acid-binding Zn ribbon protein